MSVLEGFLTTLASARATFGEGIPEHFDGEALSRVHTELAAAAPGQHWSGQAASAYGAIHAEHREVLGALAELDKKIAPHLNEAARVVAAGRQQLDTLRQFVVDLAGSLPPEVNHDQELTPVAQQATRQVIEVITRSNAELNAIGAKIQGFSGEYAALTTQRFGKIRT
jgi:EspA/EspE family